MSTPQEVHRPSLWGQLFRLLLTVAFLGYALSRVDLARAWEALLTSAWWGPVGAGLLLFVNLAVQWYRWHLLTRVARLGFTPRRSLRVLLVGYPLGILTPGRMGELGRGALVPGPHDSLGVAGLTVLERSFGVLGGVGLSAAAMILSGYGTPAKWTFIILGYSVAVAAALHPRDLAAFGGRLARHLPGRLGTAVRDYGSRLAHGWFLAGGRAAIAVLALSVLQSGVVLVQLTLCYMAAGPVAAPLLKVVGAWAVVMGAKYFLPITVGDIGVREGLAVAVFTNRGLAPEPALVAALLIYLFNILVPSLAGALVLARRGRTL